MAVDRRKLEVCLRHALCELLLREKLMNAVQDASRHYKSSSRKERETFFHGLLTGYAVALKLL
jgi:hypothetical protein